MEVNQSLHSVLLSENSEIVDKNHLDVVQVWGIFFEIYGGGNCGESKSGNSGEAFYGLHEGINLGEICFFEGGWFRKIYAHYVVTRVKLLFMLLETAI